MSTKNKKLIIVGRSGSGKSTLANFLSNIIGSRTAVLHTSRKKRPGEGGGDYHFVSPIFFEEHAEDFIFINKFTDTEDKIYGLSRKEYDESGIVILAPSYFKYFPREDLKNMSVVILNTSRATSIRRSLSRGDNPDQVLARAKNDDKDFAGIQDLVASLGVAEVLTITSE